LRWVDVAGCPGSGKSTICYPIWGDKSVTWDGKRPPPYWKPFLEEIQNLCHLVQDHPSIEAVLRMNDRSIKKMATVERMDDGRTFVQAGLVQRILGFGWRLHEMRRDINLIRTALWRMPVSVGVAFLDADLETLLERNRAREKDPRTAHENRSHQVPHMLACIPLVKEVLRARGVPVVEIDVQHQSVESARAQLLNFPTADICEPEALGPSR
jgi:hypothetical protein